MKFSVLIANYNNGSYLEECLKSIFAQTYKNWEVIIVDDASTDESHIIYEKYLTHPRIKILKNSRNKGCGYTKKRCVENAKGEICGFVDGDDALEPDALIRMMENHSQHPDHSIVYSTHYVCDEDLIPVKVADYVGPIPKGKYSWQQIRPVISHFATFKRVLYKKTLGLTPTHTKAIDKELYYLLEETGPVLFVNKPLYKYRHHSQSISLNKNASVAYKYHLVIKSEVIFRSKNFEKTLSMMPHTKTELVGALLFVGTREILRYGSMCGFNKIFKALRYYPIPAVRWMLLMISHKILLITKKICSQNTLKRKC